MKINLLGNRDHQMTDEEWLERSIAMHALVIKYQKNHIADHQKQMSKLEADFRHEKGVLIDYLIEIRKEIYGLKILNLCHTGK